MNEMSVVYFMTSGSRIKIGVTTDLPARHAALRRNLPDDLSVIAIVPGSFALEKSLHQDLHAFRLKGEWFRDCAEVRGAIDLAVARHGGAYDPEVRTGVGGVWTSPVSPARPDPVADEIDGPHVEGNDIAAAMKGEVVRFSEIIHSSVIHDLPKLRNLEKRRNAERGSLVAKNYRCSDPIGLHLRTVRSIHDLHERHMQVGDQIILAVVKQDPGIDALLAESKSLLHQATEAFAALKAVYRPGIRAI